MIIALGLVYRGREACRCVAVICRDPSRREQEKTGETPYLSRRMLQYNYMARSAYSSWEVVKLGRLTWRLHE